MTCFVAHNQNNCACVRPSEGFRGWTLSTERWAGTRTHEWFEPKWAQVKTAAAALACSPITNSIISFACTRCFNRFRLLMPRAAFSDCVRQVWNYWAGAGVPFWFNASRRATTLAPKDRGENLRDTHSHSNQPQVEIYNAAQPACSLQSIFERV